MNIKFKITFILLIVFQAAFSQKKDENIGTEVVNVVKPYTPTISDAFKVKETPPLDDEDITKKKEIKYNIFSFPVASTFAPSKGRAANVDKEEQARLYKNFATLGGGNYFTVNGELFITEDVGETGYVGGMLRHLSSNGGIENVLLEDSYNNSSADLTYGNKQSNLSFNIDLGYQNQGYNWYGLPKDFGFELEPGDYVDLFRSIEPGHTYHNAYLGGKVGFNESIFNEASLKYNRFWDSYGSEENRFYVKPVVSFDINNTRIKTRIIVDYINGKFDETLHSPSKTYGITNLGLHPSFDMVRDDWSINFGAAAFFSMDMENSDNKFFIYPQVSASYKVVGDLMIFYAGAEGTLQQNSYRDFTNENPFLAPTQQIAPTDRQFDVFGGLKGKLANTVSYNLRTSIISEQSRALIKSNNYFSNETAENFEYGNSFGVVYDDMRTLSFFGELKADFS
ncbi:MAG TPA: TonB-dependent receptor, partial [Flavobacterium sp.]